MELICALCAKANFTLASHCLRRVARLCKFALNRSFLRVDTSKTLLIYLYYCQSCAALKRKSSSLIDFTK